jgi:uncharacterized protein (TIRG00374 family)
MVLSLRGLPGLAAAAILCIVANIVNAFRQKILLKHMGEIISFGYAFKITFAGTFADNILPAGTGSDLVKLLYFRRIGCQTAATVGGLILLDRALGMIGLSILAVLTMASLPFVLPQALPQQAYQVLFGALFALVALTLWLFAFRQDSFFALLIRLAKKAWMGEKIQELLTSLRQHSSKRPMILLVTFLAIAGHLCAMMSVACIAYGTSGILVAMGSFLLSPVVLFSASIPITPANFGVTETIAETTLAFFGLQGGLIIFLARRAVNMLVSLGGCVSYIHLQKI